jgi:hypothetical protein
MKSQTLLGDHKIVAAHPTVQVIGMAVQKPRSRLTHVGYRLGLRSRVQSPSRIFKASCGTGCIGALDGHVKFTLYFSPKAFPVFGSEDTLPHPGQVFQRFAFPPAHRANRGERQNSPGLRLRRSGCKQGELAASGAVS